MVGNPTSYENCVNRQPPEMREVVIMGTDEKGKSMELKRTWTYSENELIRSRLELGEQLQNLLAELETEYELRNTQSVLCDQYKE